MNNNTCKDCVERVVGCHATCEKYKEFVAENERLKQLKRQDTMKDLLLPVKNNKREKNWKW